MDTLDNMGNLDMKGAHEIWMQMLDAAYQRLRNVHADTNWSNDNSEYKELVEEFMYIQKQIF